MLQGTSLETITFEYYPPNIEENAFRGCINLKEVYFPKAIDDEDLEKSVTKSYDRYSVISSSQMSVEIAESAFINTTTGKPYSDNLTFYVYKDSVPYDYAVKYGIDYVLLD